MESISRSIFVVFAALAVFIYVADAKSKKGLAKPKVNFGIKGKILPKTVEDGTPGGSAYLCIANATSPIGQGCDAASQQAYKGLMGKYAANIQKTACVQVMGGICVQSDFVNIQAGLDIISGETSGLIPSLTTWLQRSNIHGVKMTVQIKGYDIDSVIGNPDATAEFSCWDKTMVPLPSSVCKK